MLLTYNNEFRLNFALVTFYNPEKKIKFYTEQQKMTWVNLMNQGGTLDMCVGISKLYFVEFLAVRACAYFFGSVMAKTKTVNKLQSSMYELVSRWQSSEFIEVVSSMINFLKVVLYYGINKMSMRFKITKHQLRN